VATILSYAKGIVYRHIPELHALVVFTYVCLATQGGLPQTVAGWITCPPTVYTVYTDGRRYRDKCRCVSWSRTRRGGRWVTECRAGWDDGWRYAARTWHLSLMRSVALAGLWLGSGQLGPPWIIALPLGLWLWRVGSIFWPWLAVVPPWSFLEGLQQTARLGERLVLWGYLGLALTNGLQRLVPSALTLAPGWADGESVTYGLLGLLGTARSVSVWRDTDGGCIRAELNGHFTLAVADDDRFRLRLLILFLLLLEVTDQCRGSRRTRDGRTPFVRQQDLATALGIPQPDISRWVRYWLEGDWRRLLSQYAKEILTDELRQKIIETWARVPNWGVQQVHQLLVESNLKVTVS